MKINEILVESQQLNEGPLDAIGRGVGKLAGGTAKAIGSVAGGVAGLGSAFMKGYRGGKATVSGDEEEPADSGDKKATDGGSKEPEGGGASGGSGGGSAGGNTAPAPGPTTKTKPKSTFGKLTKAADGGEEPAPAPAPGPEGEKTSPDGAVSGEKEPAPQDAGGTAYAQAQKAVQSLPPEQRKEIVTMLQSDPKVKSVMDKSATEKPAAKPVAGKPGAGAGAFGAMAKQLGGDQPAAEPTAGATKSSTGGTVEKTPGGVKHTANPNNPNAAKPGTPAAEPAAEKPGFLKTATDKIKDKAKKPAKPSQAEIDADRDRVMGVTSDSIIRKGLMVSESFSLFRKR